MKFIQPWRKPVWRVLEKLKLELLFDQSTLGLHPEEMKLVHQRAIYSSTLIWCPDQQLRPRIYLPGCHRVLGQKIHSGILYTLKKKEIM